MTKLPSIRSPRTQNAHKSQKRKRSSYLKGLSPWFPGLQKLDVLPAIAEEAIHQSRNSHPNALCKAQPPRQNRKLSVVDKTHRNKPRSTTKSAKLTAHKSRSKATKNRGLQSYGDTTVPRTAPCRPAEPEKASAKFLLPPIIDRVPVPNRYDSVMATLGKTAHTDVPQSGMLPTDMPMDIDLASIPESSVTAGSISDVFLDLEDNYSHDSDETDSMRTTSVSSAPMVPTRFGATLSKEAAMAMLMGYDDVLRDTTNANNFQTQPISVRTRLPSPRPRFDYTSAETKLPSLPTGPMVTPDGGLASPEDDHKPCTQIELSRRFQKATTILDKINHWRGQTVAMPCKQHAFQGYGNPLNFK